MNLKNLIKFHVPEEYEPFSLEMPSVKPVYDVRKEIVSHETLRPSKNIEDNFEYMKNRYSLPMNSDIVIRRIMLKCGIKCFLMFVDGIVDTDIMDKCVIGPLLSLPELIDLDMHPICDVAEQKIMFHNQVKRQNDLDKICDDINYGSVAVFLDGADEVFSLDVRKWEHRNVDKPENEQSIYGPQEAFTEMLRSNTALIRKTLKTEKLICKSIEIGKISKTPGVIMYISDIANSSLVSEVQKRIDAIDIDFIFSVEEVSMMIEESSYFFSSQIMSTERPDRTARALADGRVAVVLNGSPNAIILPTNAMELTHSASDSYLRIPYAIMTRIVRIFAMLLSILLPSMYIAITLFHQEMVPTDLLYSISSSRENVPFPSIFEMLLMEISFEMIREAGIRMPGPVGSTLGIVGGLILGQAAVSAKIVSPIMIIIIAITGIGSFATSNYSLAWTFRVMRIVFLILAATTGFFGISIGIFLYSIILASQKSFGIPFLSPLPNAGKSRIYSSVLIKPLWKNQTRPDFLDTKKPSSEPDISRKWFIKRRK